MTQPVMSSSCDQIVSQPPFHHILFGWLLYTGLLHNLWHSSPSILPNSSVLHSKGVSLWTVIFGYFISDIFIYVRSFIGRIREIFYNYTTLFFCFSFPKKFFFFLIYNFVCFLYCWVMLHPRNWPRSNCFFSITSKVITVLNHLNLYPRHNLL